jgi:hypothetical protein
MVTDENKSQPREGRKGTRSKLLPSQPSRSSRDINLCSIRVSSVAKILLPKLCQLFRAEIRQHLAIHVQHRREFLAGKADHLGERRVVRDHVQLLVGDVVVVEPAHRLATPTAIRLDE